MEELAELKEQREKLVKRICRLKKQTERYVIKDPQNTFNYFGGFDYGYIRGKIAMLEERLDELEEKEEN